MDYKIFISFTGHRYSRIGEIRKELFNKKIFDSLNSEINRHLFVEENFMESYLKEINPFYINNVMTLSKHLLRGELKRKKYANKVYNFRNFEGIHENTIRGRFGERLEDFFREGNVVVFSSDCYTDSKRREEFNIVDKSVDVNCTVLKFLFYVESTLEQKQIIARKTKKVSEGLSIKDIRDMHEKDLEKFEIPTFDSDENFVNFKTVGVYRELFRPEIYDGNTYKRINSDDISLDGSKINYLKIGYYIDKPWKLIEQFLSEFVYKINKEKIEKWRNTEVEKYNKKIEEWRDVKVS